MVILAARLETGMCTATRSPGKIAEKGLEEVTETGTATKTGSAELEAGVPVRGRMELLTGFPVCAKLVIGGAFLRILEHLVSFAEFLEADFCIRLLADIRMVLACQFAVGALDFITGGITLNPHNCIIIFEIHARY